jgi:hypothetical protein
VSDELRDTSLSSAVSTVFFTLFIGVFILSVLAGSSAGNLSKDFPLKFRLAAFFRTTVLMFIVVPLSYLRRR